ncbi:MAG: NUDIX domain-containing protein [Candidatus Bathyarchaeota archaeon]|nr:NUDIX domain-containing protein [Candidatus Bathyarchaeota archaeon]
MKRLYPDQPVVGVGIVVVHGGKIVLIKRGNEPGKGKWSVPGGIVELGEHLEDTVIREAKEETLLTVDSPKLVDVVDTVDLDEQGKIKYHYIIADYLVQVRGGEIGAASDADELRWVPFDEVESYVLTASFRHFFQQNRGKLSQADSYP